MIIWRITAEDLKMEVKRKVGMEEGGKNGSTEAEDNVDRSGDGVGETNVDGGKANRSRSRGGDGKKLEQTEARMEWIRHR
uniref:Uncharacterized protein n=1 Tax=Setaria digitata TaxID=48799 RepID=A0A915PUK2_9BILA